MEVGGEGWAGLLIEWEGGGRGFLRVDVVGWGRGVRCLIFEGALWCWVSCDLGAWFEGMGLAVGAWVRTML